MNDTFTDLAQATSPVGVNTMLLGVWACACRSALGAGCVVVLVGPVGGGVAELPSMLMFGGTNKYL